MIVINSKIIQHLAYVLLLRFLISTSITAERWAKVGYVQYNHQQNDGGQSAAELMGMAYGYGDFS